MKKSGSDKLILIVMFGSIIITALSIINSWNVSYAKPVIRTYLAHISSSEQFGRNISAGEIVTGTVIEQPVFLPDSVEGESVYMGILLDSYNRKNNSQIEISLEQYELKKSSVIDTTQFGGKSYQKVYFLGGIFKPGEATIKITGIDGTPGNAVTAWLTSKVPFGGAYINGELKEHGIVFWLGCPVESPVLNIGGRPSVFWAWVGIYLASVVILVCFFWREPND